MLLRREDRKGALKRWFWMIMLATAELYGGMYLFTRPLCILCTLYIPSDSSLELFVRRAHVGPRPTCSPPFRLAANTDALTRGPPPQVG